MTILFAFALGAFTWWLCTRRGEGRRGVHGFDLRFTGARGRRFGMKEIEVTGQDIVDIELCHATVTLPLDADGRAIKGTFAWTVEEQVAVEGETGDVVTVIPAADGLSADVVSGVPGTAKVAATFSGLNGVPVLKMWGPITVKYGDPETINLVFGAPTPEQP
jgi:hypothetical protein